MPSDSLELDMEFAKFNPTWPTVNSAYPGLRGKVDRGRAGKRIASGVATGASVGLTAAELGTGTSALAVGGTVAAGAAVSATGVGLVAAAGALTVGSIFVNARSMVKTIAHCENLKDIKAGYDRGRYNVCERESAAGAAEMAKDHDWIGSIVLPYIIRQKTEKAVKKGIGSAGLGVLTTLYSMGRAAYKSISSTKGVRRSFYAHVLARHLITHECQLAEAIVAELLSPNEMAILKTQNSDVVGAAIADKLKSV
ncbi:MAG: hypothetical protein J0H14_16825 [Alphaproteobacteria bacterium]|nr:hypothetical protein [Alphaproteobacteria bacterium]